MVQNAVEAAAAAVAQDKFWQIHDYLFEHQKVLDHDHLLPQAE
jgi:protein-disulfide isomerase